MADLIETLTDDDKADLLRLHRMNAAGRDRIDTERGLFRVDLAHRFTMDTEEVDALAAEVAAAVRTEAA